MQKMQKKRSKGSRATSERKHTGDKPVINPHAAGIDIAVNSDIWAAVGEEVEGPRVRAFSPLTPGLEALLTWFKECGVRTVAMEATGVYWVTLYAMLQAAGIAVLVVNARSVKSLKAKSDIADCQWLQYLHSVGLLAGSFVPSPNIIALRGIARHRDNLIRQIAGHLQHMQKALDEMNVHIHHVIDDLGGVTGVAIIEAILAGERDPKKLASLRHKRIRASEHTLCDALSGHWREEQIFILRQSYDSWRSAQSQVAQCDEQLWQLVEGVEPKLTADQLPQTEKPGITGRRRNARSRNQPLGQWRERLHMLFGVDLTAVPGLRVMTALNLLVEIGSSWGCFATSARFASWLGLCPNNRISSGKVLGRGTRKEQNRVKDALKMAAQGLAHSKTALGDQYRRLRARLGPAQANTAMAHRLARILWHMVVKQVEYDETVTASLDVATRSKQESRLRRMAAKLGYQLAPLALNQPLAPESQ
jgi:transposase